MKSPTLFSKLWLLAAILLLAACAAPGTAAPPTPFAVARADTPIPTMTFTATFTPAPTDAPTETPIPLATETPTSIPTDTPIVPTETPNATPTQTATETAFQAGAATLTPTPTRPASGASTVTIPTPTVVIPEGWPIIAGTRLGYSLAAPTTWLRVDLRGNGFKTLARLFGTGAAGLLDQIDEFLATPAGESIGLMAVEADITQLFSPVPFPAFAIVSVIDIPPDVTAEELSEVLAANAGIFGAVTVESSEAETLNNLPGVRVIAQADMAQFGLAVQAYVEQVGLLANDKLYVLTLATKVDGAERKRAIFDKIIGSFRPE
ncbi:MAG: hypothetical protein KBG20_11020 [Caldilineaceae bacterium]|nr:hypothetical protein [Caldilineaceae bacterium]MBP8108031.1 hypothetical protein [Caldilineaceae bacterium]MBP8124758.1 hypothetical protein [Caldilineaceae bacterium]MBP9072826.1 hypothetical protein [Caldilineaceae bacterium]